MYWTTPTLIEICIGLEINGYLPAEFSFKRHLLGNGPPAHTSAGLFFTLARLVAPSNTGLPINHTLPKTILRL